MLIGQLPCDLNSDLTNIDRRLDKFGGWENRGGVYLKLPVAQLRHAPSCDSVYWKIESDLDIEKTGCKQIPIRGRLEVKPC
ncbi:hypothetical protein DPMN_040044 [Dreissena polymorpha]|uniref:Uncharacterized protein n=1 Tax=Dreissena polymorpha TaxID=45954 RepID=A0A9D4HUM2_DREPO|nr:hypothetical protein DPMN_040044 [Dreissena polymorpha]